LSIRTIRGSCSASSSRRERSEKPPLPRACRRRARTTRADVVAFEESGVPGGRVDHVAVPLDEQRVGRRDVRQQRLQHEVRVAIARRDRRDGHDLDPAAFAAIADGSRCVSSKLRANRPLSAIGSRL
jgi:hypothetical protein